MIIKKINALSASKTFALCYAIIGFLTGSAFLIMSLLGLGIYTETETVPVTKTLGGISILVFPIVYGILGALSGLIFSFLYNFVTNWTGGIEMDVE